MATFNQALYKNIELHFQRHSAVPTADKLAEQLEIPIEQIEAAFDDDEFINILKSSYLYEYYNSAPGDLSLAQLSALHVFANQHDRRTPTQKFKALRITSQQFNRWMQDPVFSRTLNSRVQATFKDQGFRVFQSLLESAASGDFNSTKLYMEMNGHYTPSSRQTSTNVSVSVKSVDLLIEVILRVLGPLPDGQQLISQITNGFEEVLTTGSLTAPIQQQLPPAAPSLPSNILHVSPVEEVRSSGKLTDIEDFLQTVSDTFEDDDDLGI